MTLPIPSKLPPHILEAVHLNQIAAVKLQDLPSLSSMTLRNHFPLDVHQWPHFKIGTVVLIIIFGLVIALVLVVYRRYRLGKSVFLFKFKKPPRNISDTEELAEPVIPVETTRFLGPESSVTQSLAMKSVKRPFPGNDD